MLNFKDKAEKNYWNRDLNDPFQESVFKPFSGSSRGNCNCGKGGGKNHCGNNME